MVKLSLIALGLAGLLSADEPATGLWRNTDGDKATIVKTSVEGGKLTATIVKVLRGGVEDKAAKCDKCQGAEAGKSMAGLEIIRDLTKQGAKWDGGTILDPDTGKTYKCRVEPQDGGKKLAVRGSVAFLSKTQTWVREN